MNLQPTLQNDLLKLRPLVAEDLEPLYAAANDPKIWDQHFDKRNEREVFEAFFAEALASGGALTILHRNSGKVIGSSRYYMYDGFPDSVEIGWTFLSRDYWGGMYNKMLKKLMIDHALKSKSAVYLFIDHENYRSQKAALKIGAKQIDQKEKAKHPETRAANVSFIVKK